MHKNIIFSVKSTLMPILKITIGTSLMGVSLSAFLAPFSIAPGGVSGLSVVINYLTGIRVSALILLINIPIFIVGFLSFDLKFLLRSLYGTVSLSFFAELASLVSLPISDTLLASVFGGMIMGIGIALVITAGGTSGGTDILVLVIRKSFPQLSVGRLFLVIDGAVILLAGIVFKSAESILYSAATLIISGYLTDAVVDGVRFARVVYIISEKSEIVTAHIYKELKRGVTGLKSVSMYTGAESKVLMCVVRKHELFALRKIIKSVDERAFVIVSDAKEVIGNGFELDINI